MANQTDLYITRFRGLNNVFQRTRFALQRNRSVPVWLTKAENVEVDDSEALVRRRSLEKVSDGGSAAYVTKDGNWMYVVRGSQIYLFSGGAQESIYSGLTPGLRVHFTEVNSTVYCTNGVDFLVLRGAKARTWGLETPPAPEVTRVAGDLTPGLYQFQVTWIAPDGRESGASGVHYEELGEGSGFHIQAPSAAGLIPRVYMSQANGGVTYALGEGESHHVVRPGQVQGLGAGCRTAGLFPPPGGHVPAVYSGRTFLGHYTPGDDQSVLWVSRPLMYEHFSMQDFYVLQGEVRCAVADAFSLYVGTSSAVYSFQDSGGMLQMREELSYGVPRGAYADTTDEGLALMWTTRGLVLFGGEGGADNVTQKAVSLAPGVGGGLAVVEQDGYRKAVVLLQEAGQPHNSWEV